MRNTRNLSLKCTRASNMMITIVEEAEGVITNEEAVAVAVEAEMPTVSNNNSRKSINALRQHLYHNQRSLREEV